jgi:hypothetical protein
MFQHPVELVPSVKLSVKHCAGSPAVVDAPMSVISRKFPCGRTIVVLETAFGRFGGPSEYVCPFQTRDEPRRVDEKAFPALSKPPVEKSDPSL